MVTPRKNPPRGRHYDEIAADVRSRMDVGPTTLKRIVYANNLVEYEAELTALLAERAEQYMQDKIYETARSEEHLPKDMWMPGASTRVGHYALRELFDALGEWWREKNLDAPGWYAMKFKDNEMQRGTYTAENEPAWLFRDVAMRFDNAVTVAHCENVLRRAEKHRGLDWPRWKELPEPDRESRGSGAPVPQSPYPKK